jgi:hypothetical protein
MNRIVLFLVFLCFSLLGRPEHAHADNARTIFFSAAKDLCKVQPLKSTHPRFQVATGAGQDAEQYHFDIAEDQDEDDIFRKHDLQVRYIVAFFCKYFSSNNERSITKRLPPYQYGYDNKAPRYIVLRVILV